jgi:hypothetical protein
MRIQYVSRYIALSEEGLVVKMECPFDQGPLLSNLNKEDEIFLYCLSCSYKKTIGYAIYTKMVEAVKKIDRL